MRRIREYIPSLAAAIFLTVLLLIAFPFYQYYIDPDATAYLTVAKRYAAGDFQKAVNGYWSPWAIWCTALLINAGIASFKAAIIVNAIGALAFLLISHSLLLLFRLPRTMQWLLNTALAVFMLYAVFWQSFDDLWECFFLLCVLRVMLREDFGRRTGLWIAAGLLGALSYFAKAYALPFFILEVIVCGYFITDARMRDKKKQWLKVIVVCIVSMLFFSFPWIYMLYEKYGIWTTGTAGSLNMSWYLVGHPYWKEGILHLLPPTYPDSPSYWEDVYTVNGATPHFWSSPRLFALQIVRLGYNLLKFVQSINEISAFFGVAVIVALVIIFSKRAQARMEKKFALLCISFLLFPLGYALVNFQARYLWYMLPLSMIILAVVLQRTPWFYKINRELRLAILVIFAFSFIAYPIIGLKEMYKTGEKEFRTAQALKEKGIHGSFTTNIPYSKETQNIMRLAYFSGNPYYTMPLPVSMEDLLKEMKRYKVKYYFHFYENNADAFQLKDDSGIPLQEVTEGTIEGLKVFQLSN